MENCGPEQQDDQESSTDDTPVVSEEEEMNEGDGETYIVEKIVNMKMEKGIKKFRVRWQGFAPDQDTWEPEDNLRQFAGAWAVAEEFERAQLEKKRKAKEAKKGFDYVLETDVEPKDAFWGKFAKNREVEAHEILGAGVLQRKRKAAPTCLSEDFLGQHISEDVFNGRFGGSSDSESEPGARLLQQQSSSGGGKHRKNSKRRRSSSGGKGKSSPSSAQKKVDKTKHRSKQQYSTISPKKQKALQRNSSVLSSAAVVNKYKKAQQRALFAVAASSTTLPKSIAPQQSASDQLDPTQPAAPCRSHALTLKEQRERNRKRMVGLTIAKRSSGDYEVVKTVAGPDSAVGSGAVASTSRTVAAAPAIFESDQFLTALDPTAASSDTSSRAQPSSSSTKTSPVGGSSQQQQRSAAGGGGQSKTEASQSKGVSASSKQASRQKGDGEGKSLNPAKKKHKSEHRTTAAIATPSSSNNKGNKSSSSKKSSVEKSSRETIVAQHVSKRNVQKNVASSSKTASTSISVDFRPTSSASLGASATESPSSSRDSVSPKAAVSSTSGPVFALRRKLKDLMDTIAKEKQHHQKQDALAADLCARVQQLAEKKVKHTHQKFSKEGREARAYLEIMEQESVAQRARNDEFAQFVRSGKLKEVRKMLEEYYDIDVDQPLSNGFTLTMIAAGKRCGGSDHTYCEIIELLLGHGASAQTLDGCFSALTMACRMNTHCIVSKLLNHSDRVPVNLATREHNSALTIAAKYSHHRIVRRLVKAGADVGFAGKSAATALQVATAKGRKNATSALEEGCKSLEESMKISIVASLDDERIKPIRPLFPVRSQPLGGSREFSFEFLFEPAKVTLTPGQRVVLFSLFAATCEATAFSAPADCPIANVSVNGNVLPVLEENLCFTLLHKVKEGNNRLAYELKPNLPVALQKARLLAQAWIVEIPLVEQA